MAKDLLRLDVAALTGFFRRGTVSPADALAAALSQVAAHNGRLRALCHVDEKTARAAARASARRWQAGTPLSPIDGVPVTVKDWFHVKGWPTRYGSLSSGGEKQKEDSPPVARLREAGAVIIGKTTLPEYGHKGVTDSPLTGVTRNPWDEKKTSGGSSGGAAVAAATRMGWLHLGSDAGGSVRIPASFSGVVGFKASQGMVPNFPPSLFSTLSSAGPLARSVDDCAMMLDVITAPDARDWHALPVDKPSFALAARQPLRRPLNIAYAPVINGQGMTDDVARVIKSVLPALRALGTVRTIALDVPDLVGVFNRHWMAVASYMMKDMTAAEKRKTDPRLLHWARRGDALELHDYLAAERARMDIGAYFKSILDDADILVTPSTAMAAFDAGRTMPRDAKGRLWDDWTPFTYPANLARLPAISIPAGLTQKGLPVGLQIMSGYLKDALVLRVARRLEKTIAFAPWR